MNDREVGKREGEEGGEGREDEWVSRAAWQEREGGRGRGGGVSRAA